MESRALDATSEPELARVLELVKLVYGRPMSAAFYRWRFLQSPFGAPLVTLLWDGDVLAGHYALSPTRSWSAALGGGFPSAQSMTTMTHPDYRNRGVFTQLAADLYARAEASGVRMVWGMPNTQSHFGFREKLGWRDIGVMFTMTRVLDDHAATAASAPELHASEQPPAEASALFAQSDDGRFFASARELDYLRWRYADHPEVRYEFLSQAAGDGALDAFVVVKEYVLGDGRRALEVVDYLYGCKPDRFSTLLRSLLGWARARGYAMVRTWMGVTDPAFGALEKLGFVPREPLAYVGGRTFGATLLPEATWSPAGAYLTMGDSDNY